MLGYQEKTIFDRQKKHETLYALEKRKNILHVVPDSVSIADYLKTFLYDFSSTPLMIVTVSKDGAVRIKEKLSKEKIQLGQIGETVDHTHLNYIGDIDTLISKPTFSKIKMLIIYGADNHKVKRLKDLFKKYANCMVLGFGNSSFSPDGYLLPFSGVVNNYDPTKWINSKHKIPAVLVQTTLTTVQKEWLRPPNVGTTKGLQKYHFIKNDLRRIVGLEGHLHRMLEAYLSFKTKSKKMIIFALDSIQARKIKDKYSLTIDKPIVTAIKDFKGYDYSLQLFAGMKEGIMIHEGVLPEGVYFSDVDIVQIQYPIWLLSDFLKLCEVPGANDGQKKSYTLLDHGNNILRHGSPEQDRTYWLSKRKVGSSKHVLIGAELQSSEYFNLSPSDYKEQVGNKDIDGKNFIINSASNHIYALQEYYFKSIRDDISMLNKMKFYDQFCYELEQIKITPAAENVESWKTKFNFPDSWKMKQLARIEKVKNGNSK